MEALKKYQCLAACASLWRQPSLFGDDTHAVGTRPRWAQEHGIHTECGPLCRWVASLAHRQVLGTRTWAEVNVRPRPLVNVNRREDIARPVKTTLWKFTCVDNVTFWKVHGNTQQQHTTKPKTSRYSTNQTNKTPVTAQLACFTSHQEQRRWWMMVLIALLAHLVPFLTKSAASHFEVQCHKTAPSSSCAADTLPHVSLFRHSARQTLHSP